MGVPPWGARSKDDGIVIGVYIGVPSPNAKLPTQNSKSSLIYCMITVVIRGPY